MTNQLPKLSKEAIERLVVGLVVAAAVGYAAWNFLLAPMKAETAKTREEAEAVGKTLATNQALVDRKAATNADYEVCRKRLLAVMTDAMPPKDNALAWIGDFFRQVAASSATGVKAQRTQDMGVSAMPSKDKEVPLFEEYGVRTEYAADYHAFGNYLAVLENADPLMRVDGFEMTATARLGDDKFELGKLNITLRNTFIRFTDNGFLAEERPDAEKPRVASKQVVAKKRGEAGGGDE